MSIPFTNSHGLLIIPELVLRIYFFIKLDTNIKLLPIASVQPRTTIIFDSRGLNPLFVLLECNDFLPPPPGTSKIIIIIIKKKNENISLVACFPHASNLAYYWELTILSRVTVASDAVNCPRGSHSCGTWRSHETIVEHDEHPILFHLRWEESLYRPRAASSQYASHPSIRCIQR